MSNLFKATGDGDWRLVELHSDPFSLFHYDYFFIELNYYIVVFSYLRKAVHFNRKKNFVTSSRSTPLTTRTTFDQMLFLFQTVGVSATDGLGIPEFFQAIDELRLEYIK